MSTDSCPGQGSAAYGTTRRQPRRHGATVIPPSLYKIERLRALTARRSPRLPVRERSSEVSLRQRLQLALDENRRLRTENAQLKDELALAYGVQRAAATR